LNPHAPFLACDLQELDERLLSVADRVVPMRDIHKGDTGDRVIGLRHDVDDNPGSFQTALAMAEWEFEHGYSSTYFLLHDAHYWEQALDEAPRFEELGHEVGIHVNAIAEGLRQQRLPSRVLARAIFELCSTGVNVRGCVAHGDRLCHDLKFVNDEMFKESRREEYGDANRRLELDGYGFEIEPISRGIYGLEYDANWLPRGDYVSESGGRWSQPFERVVSGFDVRGQLHVLIHPDWWGNAFVGALA